MSTLALPPSPYRLSLTIHVPTSSPLRSLSFLPSFPTDTTTPTTTTTPSPTTTTTTMVIGDQSAMLSKYILSRTPGSDGATTNTITDVLYEPVPGPFSGQITAISTSHHSSSSSSLSSDSIYAVGGLDKAIYILNSSSSSDAGDGGDVVAKLTDHTGGITSISFVPNTDLLISGSWGGECNVYSCASPLTPTQPPRLLQQLHEIVPHENAVCVVSLDAYTVVTASTGENVGGNIVNSKIRVFRRPQTQTDSFSSSSSSFEKYKLVWTGAPHDGPVRSLSACGDVGGGFGFVSCGNDGVCMVHVVSASSAGSEAGSEVGTVVSTVWAADCFPSSSSSSGSASASGMDVEGSSDSDSDSDEEDALPPFLLTCATLQTSTTPLTIITGSEPGVLTILTPNIPTSSASSSSSSSSKSSSKSPSSSQPNQYIQHPSTIWKVSTLPNTDDIITLCHDGVARVFSRDVSKWASEGELLNFEGSSSNEEDGEDNGNDNESGPTKEEIAALPLWERRFDEVKGTGAVQVFNRLGVAIAGQMSDVGEWVEVGEVVGQSENKKKSKKNKKQKQKHPTTGIEYDHLLEIEVEQTTGLVKLHIGVNKGDNAFTVAKNFVAEHELPGSYLRQIEDYVTKNVANKKKSKKRNVIDLHSEASNVMDVEDFVGDVSKSKSERSKTNGNGSSYAYKHLSPSSLNVVPMFYNAGEQNVSKILAKVYDTPSFGVKLSERGVLDELGAVVKSSSRYHSSVVTSSALVVIDSLVKRYELAIDSKGSSSSSSSSPSDDDIIGMFPLLDLVRLVLSHPTSIQPQSLQIWVSIVTTVSSYTTKKNALTEALLKDSKIHMLASRLLCNLLKQKAGQTVLTLALPVSQLCVEYVEEVLKSSVASKNAKSATVALFFNLGVVEELSKETCNLIVACGLRLLSPHSTVLSEDDLVSILRAVGNLAFREGVKGKGKEVAVTLVGLEGRVEGEKGKEVLGEVKRAWD